MDPPLALTVSLLLGVSAVVYGEALYHARAVTKERWSAVRKETKKPGDVFPRKQAMAYFFAELEHVLGLRELPEMPEEHAARKAAEEAEKQRGRGARWTDPSSAARTWAQTYQPRRRRPRVDADAPPAPALERGGAQASTTADAEEGLAEVAAVPAPLPERRPVPPNVAGEIRARLARAAALAEEEGAAPRPRRRRPRADAGA